MLFASVDKNKFVLAFHNMLPDAFSYTHSGIFVFVF